MIAHGVEWFDGEDIIATDCEPRGTAAEACADIEDRCARHGEHVEKRLVHFFKGEWLVLVDELACVLIVMNGRHHRSAYLLDEPKR